MYSVCPILTNPVDWLKTLSNGKNSSLKVENFKIFGVPSSHPPVTDWRVLKCWGKNDFLERGGGND